MATLDRVIEMQNQGLSEDQIFTTLQNEGIYPQEISDALAQAKVKNEISQSDYAQNQEVQDPSQMQPPLPQNENYDQQAPPINQSPEQYPADQSYYPQTPNAYQDQNYYAPSPQSYENVSEIAEQVAIEKITEFKSEIGDIQSLKAHLNEKIQDLSSRLKRLESSLDKIQQAIIGRVAEFGETTQVLHHDLENLHGTVGKLMNPLVDNYNELKKSNESNQNK